MLNKRTVFVTPKTISVNKSATLFTMAKAIAAAAIALSAATQTAYAESSPLIERVITVKFSAADLSSESGVAKVYEKLEDKAKSYCRNDAESLDYLDETVEDCISDLVEQFTDSADIQALSDYHQKKAYLSVEVAQLAQN